MASTVIVALPGVDDKVQRISSEKVPHLTLCFLGENVPAEDLADIVTYVQHAASQLSPFGLTVDYRGTLGADEADVLFFEKNERAMGFDRIADFRHYLLLNDAVKRAYDSVEQFPEWTPHLTLGYPEAPAKEDTADYPGIHYVQFDRIAVWLGDFDGPEFRLEYESDMMEVSMSNTTAASRGASAVAEMFHYGKKGMRWGVTTVDKASKPTLTREKDLRVTKSSNVTVTQRKPGRYAKAKGGKRLRATDDAVKAVAARQKAKKSTTDALTNDELRAAVERMNLEQQYAKLDAKTKRRGQGFVSQLFQSPAARKTTSDLLKRASAANAA